MAGAKRSLKRKDARRVFDLAEKIAKGHTLKEHDVACTMLENAEKHLTARDVPRVLQMAQNASLVRGHGIAVGFIQLIEPRLRFNHLPILREIHTAIPQASERNAAEILSGIIERTLVK